jgi:hypothetical protein
MLVHHQYSVADTGSLSQIPDISLPDTGSCFPDQKKTKKEEGKNKLVFLPIL